MSMPAGQADVQGGFLLSAGKSTSVLQTLTHLLQPMQRPRIDDYGRVRCERVGNDETSLSILSILCSPYLSGSVPRASPSSLCSR